MGHIINPTLYRIGRILPWVSAGYKRRKKDRTRVANEDFLIYNFTRNFFLQKVYKKVIGKVKKQTLNVRGKGRKVRKNKRKKKYGKKALLNNWIIRFSHLSISRFNKTFQLNLFFFDRELQKKYRLRYQRTKKKIKAFERKKRVKKIKKLRKKISLLKRKLKRVYKKNKITTKILFNGSYMTNTLGQIIPEQGSLSQQFANDIYKMSGIAKTKIAPMNLSFKHKLKKSKDSLEKLIVYKDNTFESIRLLKDRLTKSFEIDTNYYRQLFLTRLRPKLFFKFYNQTYLMNKRIKPTILRPDRYFFSNLGKKVNAYTFTKFVNNIQNTTFGNGYKKKPYMGVIKKYNELNSLKSKYNDKTASGNLNLQVIRKVEKTLNKIHTFALKNKLSKVHLINKLQEKDMWKKHFIRIKTSLAKNYRKRYKTKQRKNYLRDKRRKYKSLKLNFGRLKKQR